VSPAPLNRPTRKTTATAVRGAYRRQQARCRRCYERALKGRRAGCRRKHRPRGAEVTGAVYDRFRRSVIRDRPQRSGESSQRYERYVSRETEKRLRRGGWYIVRGVNERPPGWTVEEDEREEYLALSYAWLGRHYL
jgi:hypothetical protein